MAPTVIPAKAGIQFFRRPAWMPASAGMTNWVALVAAYGAHVHLAHISPNLASPEGEGFQLSPKETLKVHYFVFLRVFIIIFGYVEKRDSVWKEVLNDFTNKVVHAHS